VSVILAAILLKMGAYGFFRVLLPTFPEVTRDFAPAIAALGVVNIVYGALATMAQLRDFKRFVAYSSISHMGFVMLGIAAGTSLSLGGAVFESVSHGLIAGMLFLLAGLWYDRTHTLDMTRLGGMNVATPVAATLLTFAAMANLGLPGLSGFIAEFSVLLGTVNVFRSLVYVALLGLVVVAAFNLIMLHRVVMGQPREEFALLPDADRRELWSLVPLMAGTVILGLFPSLLTRLFNGPVMELAAYLGGGR
jgi:NADH-quinone oxidoreductase subunit M